MFAEIIYKIYLIKFILLIKLMINVTKKNKIMLSICITLINLRGHVTT